MCRRLSIVLLSLALLASPPLSADELRLDAAALFDQATSQRLRLSDRAAIELARGVLYEDDGPAAGYSYRPNEEPLVDGVLVRKELLIPASAARQATLLVAPGGELELSINGQSAKLTSAGKEGNYWQAYHFDPKLLQAGKNTLVLQGTGKLWIARADDFAAALTKHPNRSAKSTNGGRTWNDQRLGAKSDIDGEYYVRVGLDQFHEKGTLTLPVIDTGNLTGQTLPAPLAELAAIRIDSDIDQPQGTTVSLRARTGKTPTPAQHDWSDWQPLSNTATIERPAGRYLQLEYELATSDPLVSPQLQQVTIATEHSVGKDWTKTVRVTGMQNPRIARTSIPFAYEPWHHSKLARLRQEQKLDEVVAGAKTEWELIERLSAWSATRWERGHLGEQYPAWDALQILQQHDDGTPMGGFCQQYNVVFLQACESFGIVGRLVSLGPIAGKIRSGHETAEIWSNEHQKWVHIDGNTAWYFVDRQSQTPLSLLELRERQLEALAGRQPKAVDVKVLAKTKYTWNGLQDWPAFADLRLIPRSNFLEQPSPLPLNQGMRGWFWPGHYAWSDDRWPGGRLYAHHVTRRDDFDWTLNQAHIVLEPLAKAGELRVHLESVTPGFDTFLVALDDGQPQATSAMLVWKLHRGRNRLQARVRNSAGREGPPGWIEIDSP